MKVPAFGYELFRKGFLGCLVFYPATAIVSYVSGLLNDIKLYSKYLSNQFFIVFPDSKIDSFYTVH